MGNTPFMGLPIDLPGVTTGPQWALDLETTKLTIDAHTHVSGQGQPIPSAGLNINSALPFGNNPATGLSYAGLQAQTTTQSGVLLAGLYQVGGNVYWNNSAGVPVQITAGGVLATASSGITGMAGTSAAVTYSQALSTFTFTSAATLSAAIDAGALTIRQTGVANSQGVTLKSPSGLAGSYNITMPSGLPAVNSAMALGNSGIITPYPPILVVKNTLTQGVNFGATETVVAGGIFGGPNAPTQSAIPVGGIITGTWFRITLYGICTSSAANTVTVKIRVGTTGTISDQDACDFPTFTSSTSGTAINFRIVIYGECTSRATQFSNIGGWYELLNGGTTGIYTSQTPLLNTQSGAGGFSANAANLISATLQTGASTTFGTIYLGVLEVG